MMNTTLIAIALGLIAAIAFVSATTGPLPLRVIFSLITPLPIMLAGLGWGLRASLIAALAGGTILVALLPTAGLFFVSTAGLPAAFLAYLATLSRPNGDNSESTDREWYPVGRLVLWTAVLASIPAFLWMAMVEAGGAEHKDAMIKVLSEAMTAAEIKQSDSGLPLSPEQIASLTKYIYAALPAATALAWMAALLLTLWMAGRIMRSSGQLTRPWPDFGKIDYPAAASVAFGAALVCASFDGLLGIAGRALTGTLLLAFMLLGLSVIHDLTRGWQWRAFVLGLVYGSLMLISLVVALPLALLGLSEGLFQFRSRFSPPPADT
jgi:hypothetical protein